MSDKDFIYLPDQVRDNDNIYCGRCHKDAIFESLNRRESVDKIIEILQSHKNCLVTV